jgi:hypothetical protein
LAIAFHWLWRSENTMKNRCGIGRDMAVEELLHHHGRMGWLDPPLAPGGMSDVISVRDRLVEQVAGQGR